MNEESQLESLAKEIDQLHQLAGIAEEVEQLGEACRDDLRGIYFKVQDKDLRCRLIEKCRQFDELRIKSAKKELQQARQRLHAAEEDWSEKDTLLFAASLGVAFVLAGAGLGTLGSAGKLVGAIAGAVSALIFAMFSLDRYRRLRKKRIADARYDVQFAKEALREQESRGETFSIWEQHSGKPSRAHGDQDHPG